MLIINIHFHKNKCGFKKITFIYNHLNSKHKIIGIRLKKNWKFSKEMQSNYRDIFVSTYLK